MMRHLFWVVTLLAIGLAGCSIVPERHSGPAPVVKPAEGAARSSDSRGEPAITIRAYDSAPVTEPQPVHGGAVVALLDTADSQRHSGDISGAIATTERALRIEPRNAHLWNRLAHLRHAQRHYQLAAEMAEKSNALAGGDLYLKEENWRLIAACRRALGDEEGASRAERQARMLR